MTRMILLTFAFLGWAWFEMSGGTGFEPGPNGVTLLASVKEGDAPAAQVAPEPAEPVVARADTGATPLTGLSSPVMQAAPVVTPDAEVAQVSFQSGDAATATAGTRVSAVSIDYREVTGSRVNLRAGPGTDFDAIGQLVRGQEVEVLQEEASGWIRLRTRDGNDVGWMAGNFLRAVN